MASFPLYEELVKNFPSKVFVISTVTSTGNRIARQKFKNRAVIIYFPLDISFIVKKVVSAISPEAVLIAETELWPNFIAALESAGVKIIVFNGRISDRSFKRYRMVKFFLRDVLKRIPLFLMQSKADADRIKELGAPEERVKETGNLKYDAAFSRARADSIDASALRNKFGLKDEDILIVAGSTHPGEEEAILRSYKVLMQEDPRPRLLIAPRHIDRAKHIGRLCAKHKFGFRPVSLLTENDRPLRQDEILILDIMGMLSGVYAAGDVVFIGGSLVKKGGQNPLEAAYYSKSVIFGPYTYNFKDITERLLSVSAAARINDITALTDSIRKLIKDEGLRRRMGENARELLNSNLGAAKKDTAFIDALLSKRTT